MEHVGGVRRSYILAQAYVFSNVRLSALGFSSFKCVKFYNSRNTFHANFFNTNTQHGPFSSYTDPKLLKYCLFRNIGYGYIFVPNNTAIFY
ncbi:hypothetical protein FKM82_008272 [Ascaphus truei]